MENFWNGWIEVYTSCNKIKTHPPWTNCKCMTQHHIKLPTTQLTIFQCPQELTGST